MGWNDAKLALFEVMALCCQATNYYLTKYSLRTASMISNNNMSSKVMKNQGNFNIGSGYG